MMEYGIPGSVLFSIALTIIIRSCIKARVLNHKKFSSLNKKTYFFQNYNMVECNWNKLDVYHLAISTLSAYYTANQYILTKTTNHLIYILITFA